MSEVKEKREITFTDYLSILLKWKKFLIINLLIVGIITTGITFLIPEKYKATSSVMIQESSSNGLLGGMMQDIGGVFSKAFGGGSGNSEDKLFGFLSSNQMAEKIISKFDLVTYYEIEKFKRDKTLKAFKEDFKFDLNDNGFIEISMIHKNPKTSADIVNYAIDELGKMNQLYAITYAKKYREFVEKRYSKNMLELQNAQDSLEMFQKKYGIYAIPEQIEIAFSAYAELEKQLSLKELERDLIKETQGESNPNYEVANLQVRLLKTKINQLKEGKNNSAESIIFLDLDNLPKIQKEFFQIKRDLEIQAKLLEFTLPMYEQALMEEQKTIPAITVIDKAVPPELKDSPKKAFIILSIFFLALFINLPLVFRGYRSVNIDPQNNFEQKEKRFFTKIIKLYNIPID
ncbi:MAG: hypothetical protein GXO85_10475 [Chlorobi bacterium]|nr:hypothetical protein [Chlorobiota bacterium]